MIKRLLFWMKHCKKISKVTIGKIGLTAGLIVILVVVASFLFAGEDGAVIKVFFSPEDDCVRQIRAEINRAQDSIDIAMYYFTSRPLAQALDKALQRGVKVRVCLDEKQRTEKYSKAKFLKSRGITVKFKNGNGVGIMHNKFSIIDNQVVITGSYNWTASADIRNDENLLIIKSKPLAKKYAAYFSRLWEGKVPDEKDSIYRR